MKAGDKVVWRSQAMGCAKTKKGTVVAEVPAEYSAMVHIPDATRASHIKFSVDKSANDRVLIAVPAGKDGQITHYYCPLKSILINQGNI